MYARTCCSDCIDQTQSSCDAMRVPSRARALTRALALIHVVAPTRHSEAPAAGALPAGQANEGLDIAILTHELWPKLVELNMAIAALSAPSVPSVGGAAGGAGVEGVGVNGTIEALRHALLNRAIAAGGVGTMRYAIARACRSSKRIH